MPEQEKIQFKYTCFAGYEEMWPHFLLTDEPNDARFDQEHIVMLTKEEVDSYKQVREEYFKWQQIIRETGYPNEVNW